MNRFKKAYFTIAVFILMGALAVACDKNNGSSTTPSGNQGEDSQYSEEIRAGFVDAYASYKQALEGGLNERECKKIAREFEDISDEVPGGLSEALFNAGMAWDKCGDRGKARDFFDKANKSAKTNNKTPGYAPALIKLGHYEYIAGKKTRAKGYFDQARESDRRSTEAYTNLGILQRENKQWSEAQLNLRRALAVNSDFMTAFAQMALLYLEVAEKNKQMLDITVLVCTQAVARSVQIKSDNTLVAPIHNIWGLALIRKGDIVRAVEQFDAARRKNPAFFEAHMNYGAVNLSFRGFEEAETAFRKAVELHPQDYNAHLSLGAALRGMERLDDARQSYEKARSIDSDAPGAYYNLAVLMQDYDMASLGDMDAQIQLLTKAKGLFNAFLNKCRGKRGVECTRKRPGEKAQDMTKAAKGRIKTCDETIKGLRNAQKIAAEVARMEAGAKKGN